MLFYQFELFRTYIKLLDQTQFKRATFSTHNPTTLPLQERDLINPGLEMITINQFNSSFHCRDCQKINHILFEIYKLKLRYIENARLKIVN